MGAQNGGLRRSRDEDSCHVLGSRDLAVIAFGFNWSGGRWCFPCIVAGRRPWRLMMYRLREGRLRGWTGLTRQMFQMPGGTVESQSYA